MLYNKTITLKNGAECVLRNGTESDGGAVLENFNLTHAETDILLSYPDENSLTAEDEAEYLRKKENSPDEIEIVAVVGGKIAGTAGIDAVGEKYKLRRRAEFGLLLFA